MPPKKPPAGLVIGSPRDLFQMLAGGGLPGLGDGEKHVFDPRDELEELALTDLTTKVATAVNAFLKSQLLEDEPRKLMVIFRVLAMGALRYEVALRQEGMPDEDRHEFWRFCGEQIVQGLRESMRTPGHHSCDHASEMESMRALQIEWAQRFR